MIFTTNAPQLPASRLSRPALLAVSVVHIALFWLLLQTAPVQRVVRETVVMLNLPITQPLPKPPPKKVITLPKPPEPIKPIEKPVVVKKTITKLVEPLPIPPKPPEPPKPVEKPKVAEVDYQEPKIVEDIKVKDQLPTNEDVTNAVVSNRNVSGVEDDKPGSKDLTNEGIGNGTVVEPVIAEPVITIRHQAPEYPGGTAALIEFMKRNLVTPGDLDIGDKKIVKVKFVVGKDGVISDITIIESPGKDYDREVSRVVKKMPRWKPGIQNDITVAVAYVLPITFMAVEE